MAKRKKNESLAEFRKRTDKDIILDTKAGEMMLDLNAPVEGRTIEGLLTLQNDYDTRDNITVSWRVPKEVMDHAKRVAMKESLKRKENIHYQKLVMGCFLDNYPMPKEK